MSDYFHKHFKCDVLIAQKPYKLWNFCCHILYQWIIPSNGNQMLCRKQERMKIHCPV